MRIASSVTAHAVSEAWSFAIPVVRSSTRSAAWWVSRRAVVMAVAMSASFSWIAWCWQIGFAAAARRRGGGGGAPQAARGRRGGAAGGHARKQALALLGRSGVGDQVSHGEVPAQDSNERGPAARQLLQDHGAGGKIEPQAAVLGRDEGAQDAELRQLLDDLSR